MDGDGDGGGSVVVAEALRRRRTRERARWEAFQRRTRETDSSGANDRREVPRAWWAPRRAGAPNREDGSVAEPIAPREDDARETRARDDRAEAAAAAEVRNRILSIGQFACSSQASRPSGEMHMIIQ